MTQLFNNPFTTLDKNKPMSQHYSVELHAEHGLVQVLTTTYNSGLVSKRYLDIKTGLPFDCIWIKPGK